MRFEIAKITDGRGRPIKIYHLNEQQATLLITFFWHFNKERRRRLPLLFERVGFCCQNNL
nr:MAG TPA: regulatory protein [Caudoviricetes sp.]